MPDAQPVPVPALPVPEKREPGREVVRPLPDKRETSPLGPQR